MIRVSFTPDTTSNRSTKLDAKASPIRGRISTITRRSGANRGNSSRVSALSTARRYDSRTKSGLYGEVNLADRFKSAVESDDSPDCI